jgi:DNA-binding response OmpR family regulator
MSSGAIQILVVDDDSFIRDILEYILSNRDYAVTLAVDGEDAWQILDRNPKAFSAILLDRTMPRLDGMGLLARIKKDARFADLPVIFQTGLDHPSDIADGIKAGAFYYLVKPVNENSLLTIVQSAVSTYQSSIAHRLEVSLEQICLSGMLLKMEFSLRTLTEARLLVKTLAGYFPQPQRPTLGISELLINAIEHGNLGISYAEKSQLLQEGKWESEIEHRLTLPQYADNKITASLERDSACLRLLITDSGEGFDHVKYMEISPDRAFDPNGRGIAMSKLMSFDTLEYLGKGNQVKATVQT